jgi:hypothetical protein
MLFSEEKCRSLEKRNQFFCLYHKKLPQKDKKVGYNPIEEIQS